MSPAALDGLLVADFTRVLAGPLCSQTLGDLGADVVKVERPGSGDDTRSWGPPFTEQGASYYLGLNRNKRSLALDLHDAADLGWRVSSAHAPTSCSSPSARGRWSASDSATRTSASSTRAPSTARSAGFGSGPAGRELPGYDLLLQAMGGLMSVTGEPGADGRPLKVGAALVDMISGLYLTNAVLAALLERERSGEGQLVEVSLMDSALAALLNQGSGYLTPEPFPGRMGNRHPSISPYETFAAGDGQIAVAVGNDSMFARLCEGLGRPELAADDRFATNAARIGTATS